MAKKRSPERQRRIAATVAEGKRKADEKAAELARLCEKPADPMELGRDVHRELAKHMARTTAERDALAALAAGCRSDVQITRFVDACAYRDRLVIAYLRKRIDASFYPDELTTVLNAIERGEHVP